MSKEAFQITEERREAKGKEERERYIQLNSEFRRIAGRDKAFLSKHCKEIVENNRTGETRDLFKKIGNIKGIFHARMSMIKDRSDKDLRTRRDKTEAARILRTLV